MNPPVFLDDKLIDSWIDTLTKHSRNAVPVEDWQRWRQMLLDAVRAARAPSTKWPVVSEYAVLDRYLYGIAAGLAAGLGTTPARDGGDSDSMILVTGLLAGAAAVKAFARAAPGLGPDVRASSAAGNAILEAASEGHPLISVIGTASAAASRAAAGSKVAFVLAGLAESVGSRGAPVGPLPSGGVDEGDYEVGMHVDGGELDSPMGFMILEQALSRVADFECYPTASGYRLRMTTSNPGLGIETVLAFGRISKLRIRFLGP